MEEVPIALLVALMFVTILSMGIGSVLAALAHAVRGGPEARLDRVHVAWIALLLIFHLNLFWHTLDLISVEEWRFEGFLYVIAGPILLFFSTDVIVAPRIGSPEASAKLHYLTLSGRFLALFALTQAWIVGADVILGRGLTGQGMINGLGVVICVALVMVKAYKVHVVGIATVWLIYLVAILLQGVPTAA